MLKCLYLCVNVYVTALTSYACACTTAKILGDLPGLTSVSPAFLLLPFKTKAQHLAFFLSGGAIWLT